MAATGSGQPLGGRDAELGVLGEMLDAVETADRALTLQVDGEPAIGKSRLSHAHGAQARSRGALVLAGRVAEFESEHP